MASSEPLSHNHSEKLLWKQRLGEFKAIYQTMEALYRARKWDKLERAYRSIHIRELNDSNLNYDSEPNNIMDPVVYDQLLKSAKHKYHTQRSKKRVAFSKGDGTRRQKK